MKIHKETLILSAFLNCFIFSLEDEKFAGVREITATKIFFYSDNDDDLNNLSPIQAILLFYREGKEVNEIKVGDQLQLKIKVRASEEFDEGKMIRCLVESGMHPAKEKNIIYDGCHPNKNFIQNWSWSKKFQNFMADFSVVPLFSRDVKNINVTMSCYAIVCLHNCPEIIDDYCIKL